jgi:hypothetical protein
MTDRRGSRFLIEVLFLLVLAVALTLTDLAPIEIAGVMLVGWIVVALFEWAAWRDEPHYGSGLPPRYYVPQVNLPPAQPLEQVAPGYPEARDEAPTWIASPALRAEVLGGEWPVAAPPVSPPAATTEEPDPWTVAELPAAPLDEDEPEPEPQPEPESEPEVEEELAIEEELDIVEASDSSEEPELDVVLVRSVQGVARYSLDPLADPPPRKRFGRGGGAPAAAVVEVPARPEGQRALPGRSNRQD